MHCGINFSVFNKYTETLICLCLTLARTKLAELYSAPKSLQNSCTAKLQLFSSILEAKQQLNSSCSGMQKRCAALAVFKSGTGTRGHWDAFVGTWDLGTRDKGLAGDSKYGTRGRVGRGRGTLNTRIWGHQIQGRGGCE